MKSVGAPPVLQEWTWTVGKGDFVGQVSLREPPPDVLRRLKNGKPLGFVSDLEVHPTRRSQGWANTLMDSLVKHADTNRIDLWTYVAPFGDSINRLTRGGLLSYYVRWGFEVVPKPEYEYELVRRCRR